MLPFFKISYFICVLSSAVLAVAVLALILGGLNKGFDLSDEAYYNLASADASNRHAFASGFGHMNQLVTLDSTDALGFRITKFGYQLLAVLVFCFALFYTAVKRSAIRKPQAILLLIPVFTVGFINYDYLPPGLSYNSWSLNATLVFCSMLLIEVNAKEKKTILITSFFTGLSIAVMLACKGPNVIIALIFYSVFKLFFSKQYLMGSLLAFFAGSVLSVVMIYGGVSDFMANMKETYGDVTKVHHASVSLYSTQLNDFLKNGSGFKIVIFECLMLVLIRILPVLRARMIAYTAAVLNVYLLLSVREGNSVSLYNDFMACLIFLLSCFMIYLSEKKALKGKVFEKNSLFVLVVLFLSPCAFAAGTNNTIFYTASHYGILFTGLGFLLVTELKVDLAKFAYVFVGAAMSFIMFTVLTKGYAETPYRQSDISQKKYPLFFSPRLSRIYEDYDRFVFMYELNKKMIKHNPSNYPVSSSFTYIGSAYVSDMPVLRDFWLPDPGYGIQKTRELLKGCSYHSQIRKMLVISNKEGSVPWYFDELNKNGIFKINEMTKCDSVYSKFNNELAYIYVSRK